ncbi:MAG: hypothetical protein PVI40_07000 [Chlamydiota bacterium]|jgi:hypothetical protein
MIPTVLPSRIIDKYVAAQETHHKERTEVHKFQVYSAQGNQITLLYKPNFLSHLIDKLISIMHANARIILNTKAQRRGKLSFIEKNIKTFKSLAKSLELEPTSNFSHEIRELEFAYALVWS